MAHEIDPRDLHRVVGGCLIWRPAADVRRGFEYLAIKRDKNHPVYGNFWGVPGGGLERADYDRKPELPDGGGWNAPLADATRREVDEETGLVVGELEMRSEFAFIRPSDDVSVFGIRFAARYVSGEVRLQQGDATEYRWVTAIEARSMRFLGTIPDEIANLDIDLRRRHIAGLMSTANP